MPRDRESILEGEKRKRRKERDKARYESKKRSVNRCNAMVAHVQPFSISFTRANLALQETKL